MSPPRKKDGCINWNGMIAKGENPNGQTSQTADSTIRNQDGLGPQEYHYHQSADGARWNDGFQPKPESFPTSATPGRTRRR